MISKDVVIITPVRNEERYLPLTIEALSRQSVRPTEWIIVDDGSTDGTWALLESAKSKYDWVRPFRRVDRGFRQSGAGVVEAFYEGYGTILSQDWKFLMKLDGDLSFEGDYIDLCIQEFSKDQSLGIGGGNICRYNGGSLEPESKLDSSFHVRGASKVYRRECWEDIGGLVRGPCWDSIDELHANMLGWKTRTFTNIKAVHHRPSGQAFGIWKDWVKGGQGNYVSGYHPVFMFVKCLRRCFARPFGVAACGLMYGFVTCYFKRAPRLVSPQLMKYVRQQQLNRLIGKSSLWE